jgi:hypothetical protein
MEWDREKGEVLYYRTGRGHAEERESADHRGEDVERIDELEFLARVVTQLPEPRKRELCAIRIYLGRRNGALALPSLPRRIEDGRPAIPERVVL